MQQQLPTGVVCVLACDLRGNSQTTEITARIKRQWLSGGSGGRLSLSGGRGTAGRS
jgi:hypothetical protein